MISIIIPLYNKEPIIERTLKSVLSQDYEDFEVVVVDDGSTDKSLSLALSCREGTKVPMNVITQENGGPSKARNTGVKHAKGEWIVFLDADDELLPGALSLFTDAIDNNPKSNFFACPFYVDNGKTRTLMFPYQGGFISNPYKTHYLGRFLPRTGAFICKKELLQNHPFNEQIRRFEDLEMLFRLYRDATIYLLSKPSMVVNQEFASASHGRKDIQEDFLGHLDFKGKSFWEKMCLYQLYLGERPYYADQCKQLYPGLDKRYDLLLLAKLLKR